MKHILRLCKLLFQKISGLDLERVGKRTFIVIDRNRRGDAWCSYSAQLRAIIESEGIDLVIDVGANEGQFAQGIRSFYSGKILSFEPVLSVFEKLKKAASADADWHVYNCALGSRECTQPIYLSKYTDFSSLLKSNDYCSMQFGESSVGVLSETVTVRRGDSIFEEMASSIRGERIFLKMDTQGYDLEVFEGFRAVLNRVVLLQSEVSLIPIYEGMPHWTESISMYEKNGFGVVGMFPITRNSKTVIEYDCLLLKGGSDS